MRLDGVGLTAATLFGIALAANAAFMLIAPGAWYDAVPGVPTTGPFNQHFLRDIGLIFALLGGAVLLGVAQPAMRVVLWGAVALWLAGHAVFHLWEVMVGICGSAVLVRDFPAVSLPAIVAAALFFWAVLKPRERAPSHRAGGAVPAEVGATR
jgi:hypothetical protein